jgi:hypothetical protein
MATTTITIPDAQLTRVVNAWAIVHGYQSFVPDPTTGAPIANPQTKGQFMKADIIRLMKEAVKLVEGDAAATTARTTAQTTVESEVVLS